MSVVSRKDSERPALVTGRDLELAELTDFDARLAAALAELQTMASSTDRERAATGRALLEAVRLARLYAAEERRRLLAAQRANKPERPGMWPMRVPRPGYVELPTISCAVKAQSKRRK